MSPVGSLSNLNDIQTDVRLKTHQTLRKITDDMERRHPGDDTDVVQLG
jgi:leucyl-tRNA synthetase